MRWPREPPYHTSLSGNWQLEPQRRVDLTDDPPPLSVIAGRSRQVRRPGSHFDRDAVATMVTIATIATMAVYFCKPKNPTAALPR
jgi:hypothetical protein